MIALTFKNLNIMTLIEPLVLPFLLNVFVKWVFIFYYIFVLELLLLWRSLIFLLWHGVTLDQYRACIGLFNSFRLIKCGGFFRASFFHYCLKFFMFSISQILKHFSFSSVNSAAAEFHFFTCFTAIVSSCNRGILKPILGRVGGGALCLFVIGI